MATIPCAKLVFSQMPKEVLGVIRDIATTAQSGLSTLKAQKQALSVSLDISLLPLKAKRAALDTLINAARAKTQIIPPNMVLQCPQLGQINTTFENALVGELEGVANLVFDIDRLTSIKTDLVAQLAQVDDGITFLDSVVASINEVLSSS